APEVRQADVFPFHVDAIELRRSIRLPVDRAEGGELLRTIPALRDRRLSHRLRLQAQRGHGLAPFQVRLRARPDAKEASGITSRLFPLAQRGMGLRQPGEG